MSDAALAAESATTVDHDKATEALYSDIRQLREQIAAKDEEYEEAKRIAVKWYDNLAAEREEVRIMTNQCVQLRQELADEREKYDRNALAVMVAFNEMRVAMVALDNMLHAQHNQRHPVTKPPLDLTPTQPLDPATRAEIDATP